MPSSCAATQLTSPCRPACPCAASASWSTTPRPCSPDAIAEGITSVINYPKPRLRINEFKKLVKGGDGLFDGVTYRDVPTVFISEAATLRATMQGLEAEKRNIDIDTGEVLRGDSTMTEGALVKQIVALAALGRQHEPRYGIASLHAPHP